jgi:hypothetical protein
MRRAPACIALRATLARGNHARGRPPKYIRAHAPIPPRAHATARCERTLWLSARAAEGARHRPANRQLSRAADLGALRAKHVNEVRGAWRGPWGGRSTRGTHGSHGLLRSCTVPFICLVISYYIEGCMRVDTVGVNYGAEGRSHGSRGP